MEEQASGGGGMDPISAIANAVGSIFSGISNMVTGRQAAKYGRLPDWLSPRDFQKKDYSIEIIIGAMFLVFIILLISLNKVK